MKLEEDPEQTQLITGTGVSDYTRRAWQPSFMYTGIFSLNPGSPNYKPGAQTKKLKVGLLEPPVSNSIVSRLF